MSLMVEPLCSRGRVLSSIGIPVRIPALVAPPPSRLWKRALKRAMAPLVLALCDFIEMTIEAAGFGMLLVLFLTSIYLLG